MCVPKSYIDYRCVVCQGGGRGKASRVPKSCRLQMCCVFGGKEEERLHMCSEEL